MFVTPECLWCSLRGQGGHGRQGRSLGLIRFRAPDPLLESDLEAGEIDTHGQSERSVKTVSLWKVASVRNLGTHNVHVVHVPISPATLADWWWLAWRPFGKARKTA